MRIFKAKGFSRFQRRERIVDQTLLTAIRRATDGLVDADLGGGLIKQRVARPGQGKSFPPLAKLEKHLKKQTQSLAVVGGTKRATKDPFLA